MFYAKKQLVGNTPIVSLLTIILLQLALALYNHPLLAFVFPFIINYLPIILINLLLLAVKIDKKFHPKQEYEENIIEEQMRNHAAEHLIAERLIGKESIYSLGCSNSHIVIWFLINALLMPFIPVTIAYLLSMFISGEIAYWLVFNQESMLAKLIYPLIKISQYFTLLEPKEQHLKTAQLTIDKLIELEEGETNER